MKQFIYTLSTVVFFLLANACTEATIFMGDGGNEGKGRCGGGCSFERKESGLIGRDRIEKYRNGRGGS